MEENGVEKDGLDVKVFAVVVSFESIRNAILAFKPSRERSIVLTKIEEAQMWMEKVARDERFAGRVIG